MSLDMRKNPLQSGFTLLEFAIVISLIGILAGYLLAKYVDLVPSAKQQAVNSVAGALNVSAMVNYYYFRIGSAQAITVHNCQDVASTLPPSQSLPAGYSIVFQLIAPNATATCIVLHSDGITSATFIGRGTT
ncbi:MAG: hypothetical protein A2103_03490 [Gammaproteobacteria bacterium GWF2_41_13]|nr:MAG: hypothetical protein A2103_03490 [Gammaproteobacteria bacterium GWF2_41_13]